MNEKQLRQQLDRCLDHVQEHVDMLSARAISKLSGDAVANHEWLSELSGRYPTRSAEELQQFRELKDGYVKKLDTLETEVKYLEDLGQELAEFQNELSVKLQRIRRNSYVQEN
ncbi:ABR062Wp [Eremothecium gossypii ATCC 10895]|uniref:Biogenesis of lysosome-related organelles complex 1 subunit BLI1 n=1 Tax=Eremothecium gossypii (strain ATCC 10895 / CBS 109.51 / FGSC 9923 / NRRL Y-1056) TaxID=284811 RepID=BLI1_EREGS|nr:ABR062Wp [Eremothecium gossypii ATCC 10895]Q75DG4.1 RecName: Full=Biogenesis of lysosome-related organelles complex 1 subunit BLI1; Short=BLOC-1 subunit BLI1; AltName: Full=BLOC-1 interactor 1 [Eremothecium gossypii ATCC 10895]AAS50832.1 ABR062Wp [Eremothecium gossypii ATCC 10895]AEY95121.1 FABR062Wp [Eremothecium gossypii FDAG1]